MDDPAVCQWFKAVLRGSWVKVPEQEVLPDEVCNDSKRWASIFLNAQENPYSAANSPVHRIFLGMDVSPDKLLTTNPQGVNLYETLQHFIVTLPIAMSSTDPSADSANLVAFLSTEAAVIAQQTLATMSVSSPLVGDDPILLSRSEVPINAINTWRDRVNFFWFQGRLYLDFYKTYPGAAVAIFQSGLNWYPEAFRTRFAAPR